MGCSVVPYPLPTKGFSEFNSPKFQTLAICVSGRIVIAQIDISFIIALMMLDGFQLKYAYRR